MTAKLQLLQWLSSSMAVFFNGMTLNETTALTRAMRDSGETLDWKSIDRPIIDKHSTGGIGDNTSLILAPLMAACGLAVPMISGRGLGHTGGTLDKLESIPGYQTQIDQQTLRQIIGDVGCAITGASRNIAPADKRLYAIRDVTATVDSLPLIVASILSKKLAAGLQALVLDVKCGDGAFMQTKDDAQALAKALVEVSNAAGVKTSALITDMDQPLANCAGNALEVKSALAILHGDYSQSRLLEVTLALGAQMLISSKICGDDNEAVQIMNSALSSGAALETFARMIREQGGPSDFIDMPERHLTVASHKAPVLAAYDGYLSTCQTRELGMSVVRLGGGRRVPTDAIDFGVGFSDVTPLGTRVSAGDPIAFVHGASLEDCQREAARAQSLWTISPEAPSIQSPILALIE